MVASIVGITGSAIGRDPYDRKSWSGSSFYLFSELERQKRLKKAFGIEVSKPELFWHLAQSFHPKRPIWKNRLFLNTSYRDSLTRTLGKRLSREDQGLDFLQIGGYFDTPKCAPANSRCFAYYDGNLTSRLKSGYSLGASDRYIKAAINYEMDLLSRLDGVFTFSEYLRRSFIEDYNVNPDKVINIGGGINLDFIPEPFAEKRYDTAEILFIGVDFERKGGQSVLKAFREVRKKIPSATLHIVGPRAVDLSENSEGIFLHGYLSKSNPLFFELIKRASLFVMPSLFEPFGIAPLEAMANEIPAIITNEWALAEMVEPGRHGDLVPKSDPLALEASILALLSNPSRLKDMGREARKHVLEKYTWEKVVNRLCSAVDGAARKS